MIEILEHIDGRKLTLTSVDGAIGSIRTVYLRKGVDSAQYLPLLQAHVEVVTVEEKGFQMVESLRASASIDAKPTLPKTAVEATKPVDMPSSANVPKLKFGDPTTFTTAVEVPHKASQTPSVAPKFDVKQKLITASWAMGCVMNSHSLAQANDAMALSTEQTMLRAKKLARELINWAEEQSAK